MRRGSYRWSVAAFGLFLDGLGLGLDFLRSTRPVGAEISVRRKALVKRLASHRISLDDGFDVRDGCNLLGGLLAPQAINACANDCLQRLDRTRLAAVDVQI